MGAPALWCHSVALRTAFCWQYAPPPPTDHPLLAAREVDAAAPPAPWRHDTRVVRAPRPLPRVHTPPAPRGCAHRAASARDVSLWVSCFTRGSRLPGPPRAPSACHCARPRRYCCTPLVWELHHTPLTLLRARAHRRVCLGARQPPPTCSLGLVARRGAPLPRTPRAPRACHCTRPRRYCGTPLVWELPQTPLTPLRARAHRRVCLGARKPPPTCSLGFVAQALALALMLPDAAAATPATRA